MGGFQAVRSQLSLNRHQHDKAMLSRLNAEEKSFNIALSIICGCLK